MIQNRHQPGAYTPGEKIGKEVIRFDEKVQNEYNKITSRKRELSARLVTVKAGIEQAKVNRAAFLANGADDIQEYNDQLYKLRAEQEGLQDALDYLSNQSELLKRQHSWIISQ